jgi:hypothetical protein
MDQSVLKSEGYDSHRAMAAHRQAAARFDEKDPDVGILARRRIEETAAHHVVPSRLEHQPRAYPVEAGEEILPALAHGSSMERGRTARHQPHRIAGRVSVDAKEGMPHHIVDSRAGLRPDRLIIISSRS